MKREVKIGLFTIIIICGSWAGIRFLSGMDIFGRSTDYYACYDDVNGISNASSILIQGVKVGSVTGVILDPAHSDMVTLRLSVKRGYRIPSNSVAKIYSPGLVSSTSIGLFLGDSPTMLEAGDTIASCNEGGMMDVAAEKLMSVADNIATVSGELTTTLGSINTILENSGENIENSISNLNSISSQIADLLTSQRTSFDQTIEGIATFSESLAGKSESIENIVDNLELVSGELRQINLGDSLSATLAELNSTLGALNSEEGTAGKLLGDEMLYDNLAAVSGSLNELITDMQSNPKRYVHFSLFGSKSKE